MTSFANWGGEHQKLKPSDAPPGSEMGSKRRMEYRRDSSYEPGRHDPEAKELLRRYLSEIHSYRQLGNVALRELEKRLEVTPAPVAEAQPPALRGFSHKARAPKLDEPTLNDRLKELSAYLHEDLTRQQNVQGEAPVEPSQAEFAAKSEPRDEAEDVHAAAFSFAPAAQAEGLHPGSAHKSTPNAPVLDRSWFEGRFAAMRAQIDKLSENIPTKRIEKLEYQFKELMERLERREKDNRPMAAVEAGLKSLAAYLEDNKQWASSQDERMRSVEERLDRLSGLVAQSHAALSATARGLEIVARDSGPKLAEKTAELVSEKLEQRLAQLDLRQPVEEMNGTVAKLSEQSKQFAQATNERLSRMQSCLDEGLDRIDDLSGQGNAVLPPNRWQEPRDDSGSDDYDGEMIAAARRAARLAEGPVREMDEDGEPLRYQIPYGEFLPEEERGNSRVGLVVAAIILLLASAAMLYLNLRDRDGSGGFSSAWFSISASETRDAARVNVPITTSSVRTQIIPAASSGKTEARLQIDPLLAAVTTQPDDMAKNAELITIGQTVMLSSEGARENAATPVLRTASLRSAAVSGDAEAQFSVGETYLQGGDVEQTLPVEERLSKAARWFRRAAEKGHAPSQYRLATLYELGKGAPKDHVKAVAWYRKAAESGHVKAMHNLAVLSVTSKNGTVDYKAAAGWFRKAAAHGLADSQYNLAILYERGLGVRKDASEAYHWFSLAAAQGDRKAIGRRDRLAGRFTGGQRARLDRAATSWTAVAANAASNGKAPEPPADQTAHVPAAVEPKKPASKLMKSAWAPQIAAVDDIVTKAQTLLGRLGYRPGPVDGILGPRTKAAIRAFQSKMGLPDTGALTKTLISKMSAAL